MRNVNVWCVRLQVTDMSGWYLTGADGEGLVWAVPSRETAHQVTVSQSDAQTYLRAPYYWSAPPAYLHKKVSECVCVSINQCRHMG